ncbi:TetR/AcrR family transcriptional regulator [Cryobacterium sp. TMT3-29-2]|uniref:TetR/AcrR family transcriptional regulator n=1 Tax=Cryobacterium sp. TMT3-29-2 TaxID=2555867 RepID=UPI0010747048|nr:TetR/AcrR family transcriptional regulator [Cryobacterium sp. TMT3-29-2]TFC93249.1 TetR/AcrR family transcriptional regulator [Cryobacterium sp. TMT3-29-2]
MSDVNQEQRLTYRQSQAMETKRRIVTAARRLFSEGGYAVTSIEQVAREAGVAVRTVYTAVGGKKQILSAICDEWIVESDVSGLAGRILTEPDAPQRIALMAHLNRTQWELGRDVIPMLEAAAASDGRVVRMLANWKDQRAGIIREAVKGLAPALRPGLRWEDAAATVRALSVPELYSQLVRDESWEPDRYETWLVRLLTAELLTGP